MNNKPRFVGEKVALDYVAENVPLWSVTVWDKKFTGVDRKWQPQTLKYKYLLSSELDALNVGGDVYLLYTGQDEGFTTEALAGDAVCDREIVSIPWGGTPTVKYFNGKFVTGDNRIATSSVPDALLNKYLYYFMKGRIVEIGSYYRGAGLKHPSMKSVLSMRISYPTIEQQEIIISQFEAIEAQILVAKTQIEKLDQLVKSRFVEMFGDPVINSAGWQKAALGENAQLINGRAYKQNELLHEGKYPVLRVGNFFSNRDWYYSDLELEQKKYCDNGDLLYAWSASFGPKIWNGGKVIFHYHIWKIVINGPYDKVFLCHLLKYAEPSFIGNTHGIGMMHLTKQGMEEAEFIVPPLELQQEFADFAAQVDKSRFGGIPTSQM